MLTPAYAQTLFDYHYWANAIVLRSAAKLTVEQFNENVLPQHGSVHTMLTHMLGAEMIWRARWEGSSPTSLLRPEEVPDLATLKDRWAGEEAAWREHLAALDSEELNRTISYVSTTGTPFQNPLWQILVQVSNHGTQHRAELAAIFTILGHSPGDLDMIKYFRERAS
jgi:uncharacterized damage-inducible protein DinB